MDNGRLQQIERRLVGDAVRCRAQQRRVNSEPFSLRTKCGRQECIQSCPRQFLTSLWAPQLQQAGNGTVLWASRRQAIHSYRSTANHPKFLAREFVHAPIPGLGASDRLRHSSTIQVSCVLNCARGYKSSPDSTSCYTDARLLGIRT